MYPLRRNRRLRTNESIRSLVRETILSPNDFIVPLFVVEGKGIKEEIPSMPNYFRLSLDLLEKEVKELAKLNLKSVLVFVKVPDHLKDNKGTEALNPNGLMQRAVKVIKNAVPEMIVMTDVALDPYSAFGHDGVIENGVIVNDLTSAILAEMSCSHAEAGADIVAPSDMMDGRIAAIRNRLDDHGLDEVSIMSYSAKFSSQLYGPFRDAVDSSFKGTRNTYQMDPANSREALAESMQDEMEGADILMVKPGIAYLDILASIRANSSRPLAVYHVSGEYAMIKAGAAAGVIDEKSIVLETMTAFKRAGADLIITYYAEKMAEWL